VQIAKQLSFIYFGGNKLEDLLQAGLNNLHKEAQTYIHGIRPARVWLDGNDLILRQERPVGQPQLLLEGFGLGR
jgi:hypothetical protein